METATTFLPLRASLLGAWTVLLALSIGYLALITGDVYVAHVPLKLIFVASTLLCWYVAGRRTGRRLTDYPLARPVLVVALAVPFAWAVVAGVRELTGDVVGDRGFNTVLQHGSRFVYLLLYFPLADAARLFGARHVRIWLWPVYGLCAATIAIWLYHLATGETFDTASLLVFKGIIEDGDQGFRVFIANQVLLICACALLLARLAVDGSSRIVNLGLGVVLFTAFLSHTRGIWLGLSVVSAVTLLAIGLSTASARAQGRLIASGALTASAVTVVAVLLLAGAVDVPSVLSDQSAGSRIEQAPKLWDAFLAHPLIGDGLGAMLESGFDRSSADPWSFELTYLQILFQMGVIGLVAILALPFLALRAAARQVVGQEQLEAAVIAGSAALVGVLVASATNPYLFSSFGMLSVSITLVLVDYSRLRGADQLPS